MAACPDEFDVVATETDIHNPRAHTAHYYHASSTSRVLLRDDARHGLLWRALLAPRTLLASTLHGLSATFLPVGYPHSVREEYLVYQTWDTIQALCSYLRGILTTKAILEGSGVGSETASALSAAMNWVFRDGVGMSSSLLFSSLASVSFDGNVKEWRLFADIANGTSLLLYFVVRLLQLRSKQRLLMSESSLIPSIFARPFPSNSCPLITHIYLPSHPPSLPPCPRPFLSSLQTQTSASPSTCSRVFPSSNPPFSSSPASRPFAKPCAA